MLVFESVRFIHASDATVFSVVRGEKISVSKNSDVPVIFLSNEDRDSSSQ